MSAANWRGRWHLASHFDPLREQKLPRFHKPQISADFRAKQAMNYAFWINGLAIRGKTQGGLFDTCQIDRGAPKWTLAKRAP